MSTKIEDFSIFVFWAAGWRRDPIWILNVVYPCGEESLGAYGPVKGLGPFSLPVAI
jgi:hypothetical protein